MIYLSQYSCKNINFFPWNLTYHKMRQENARDVKWKLKITRETELSYFHLEINKTLQVPRDAELDERYRKWCRMIVL